MHRSLVVFFLIVLIGCGRADTAQPQITNTPIPSVELVPAAPTPDAITPTAGLPGTSDLAALVAEAEQRWKARKISSYRITVLEVHSIWWAQRMVVTVNNGHVVDLQSACIPAPSQGATCTIQPVEASKYLIPKLFAHASDLVARFQPATLYLDFDPTLGYPKRIGYDDLQIADEDYGISIEAFEQLPGRPTDALGPVVELSLGETAQVDGLTVQAVEIAEDSRCPASVNCVWSGQVVVELAITLPGSTAQSVSLKLVGNGMKLEEPTPVSDGWQAQLVEVTPYPATPDGIPAEDYRVTVRLSK
jgi:hypothetical protein